METKASITNLLLDALPAKDRAQVLEGCENVDLVFGDILAEPGDTVRHAYFPVVGCISLLIPMGGGEILEVGLAGNEGFYGIPLSLGATTSPVHAEVQGAGSAWRMPAATFRRELRRLPRLRAAIHLYTHVLMSQVIQTAGCNRFHVVEQRVARWLLMTGDRVHAAQFHLTHEFLAYMLGVRRVGVTEAASALQERKLIEYSRGAVTILDRKGLERASCGCYRTDLSTYERAFG